MNETKHKYWKTTDLYLAAFLFGKGAVIVGIDAVETRATFTFIDSLSRQSWQDEFRSGRPLIDARVYVIAINTLKHKALEALIQNNGEH